MGFVWQVSFVFGRPSTQNGVLLLLLRNDVAGLFKNHKAASAASCSSVASCSSAVSCAEVSCEQLSKGLMSMLRLF